MSNLPSLWDDMDRPFGSSLTTWRPLLRQLDDFFADSMARTDSGQVFAPACDIDEREDHFLLSFDMPGINKDQINIEVHGNRLFVSGERKSEREEGRGTNRFVERRYGRFERSVSLPEGIKGEEVEATYRDGVLSVAVPKAAQARSHKVSIGEGKSGFFSKMLGNGKKDSQKSQGTVDVKSSNRQQQDAAH